MKFSLNHIKFYRDQYNWSDDPAPNGIEDLADKIGAQLGAIEEITDFGHRYEGILVVRVVSCVDHPDADRLHLCKVDDGGKAKDVERDEKGYVQVVCGAPNVHEGMLAAWLPPGSTVPSTFDKDPFVLEARAIRGQKSNGMLASPRELAISDSHEGILEIDDEREPGTLFAEAYNLTGDYIFDIENKMFTHRPDCFGMLGIAREIAGIQGQAFKSPEWYQAEVSLPTAEAEALPLAVTNELPELVPRFTALVMSSVTVEASPVWLQINLARLGLRPINNIVDLTNYFMILTGQPLHAYDYDKVKALSGDKGATLVVRNPKPGERLALLNGKTIEPRAEAIMIATDKQLIGVGGVMGGAETEVDEHTKNIILECANFDMYSIRRTSMAHGLFTDAVTRFNKGQSPLQNLAVLAKTVDDVRRLAAGQVASAVIDDNHLPAETLERASVHPPVTVTAEFINTRLGVQLAPEAIKTLLGNVEFQVTVTGDELTVKAPFWRTDIELREDVVEEVGRLYGYDKLPLDLPKRDLTPAVKDPLLELKTAVRQVLSRAGANEVLTYSFVHGNLLDKVGQTTEQAYQLGNALSPDLQYYRLSLTPSLLDRVHANVKAGYGRFALFEIGKAHNKQEQDQEGLPREVHALSLVMAAESKIARQQYGGAPYYQARRYLDGVLERFGASDYVRLEPLKGADLYQNPWIEQMVAPYEPQRSAVLRDEQGLIWGVVGEYRASVRRALKLPDFCAGFELDPLLFMQGKAPASYTPLPRFPKVEQDICLKVAADMPYQELFTFVQQKSEELKPEHSLLTLEPLDIYQRDDDQAHKQITLRLAVASYQRTLTDAEVNSLLDDVATAAQASFGAERV